MLKEQGNKWSLKPPVRVGLAGCGRLAEFGYLPAFRRVSGAVLVGVADVNLLRCKRIAPEVPAYKSIHDLIQAGGIDALIISTPTRCHLADATAASEAKLPALLEKPPGLNLSEARALLHLSPRPWIGFNRRFDQDLATLRSKVPCEGLLDLRLELFYRRKAWDPLDMKDDALLDLGPHLIDLALWLTGGDATSVRTLALDQAHAQFELTLQRGQATVVCSSNSPYRERVEIRGADGLALGTFSRGGIVAGIIGKVIPKRQNPLVNSLVNQLEALCCSVQGAHSAQPLSPAIDGVKVMSIIEAVRSSANSGGSTRSVFEPPGH